MNLTHLQDTLLAAICIFRNIELILYWCVGSWDRQTNLVKDLEGKLLWKAGAPHGKPSKHLLTPQIPSSHSWSYPDLISVVEDSQTTHVWDWREVKRSCREHKEREPKVVPCDNLVFCCSIFYRSQTQKSCQLLSLLYKKNTHQSSQPGYMCILQDILYMIHMFLLLYLLLYHMQKMEVWLHKIIKCKINED